MSGMPVDPLSVRLIGTRTGLMGELLRQEDRAEHFTPERIPAGIEVQPVLTEELLSDVPALVEHSPSGVYEAKPWILFRLPV